MMTVHYDPQQFKMEITGHAGAGKKGEDLVCAAASTLTCTLMNVAKDREDNHAEVYVGDDAAVMVQCRPEHPELCLEMFRTLLHGFFILMLKAPENVRIVIEEREETDNG